MSKRTTGHVVMDIRNFVWQNLDKSALTIFDHDDGRGMTPREAFDDLIEKLQQGHRYIGSAGCEGFDPMTGCPGHPEPGEALTGAVQVGNADLVPAQHQTLGSP